MNTNSVLLVEDETGIRELIHLYLSNRGYAVSQAEDGEQAIHLSHKEKPDLILLDIEMPGINGHDVCREIRKVSDVPIIFLSNRKDLSARVKGFEMGGDDYVTKPFDFEELELRIKTSLKRYRKEKKKENGQLLLNGELEIHLEKYECYAKGQLIPLSAKEMQILIFLAKHPEQVFSAEQIYDQIWGIDSFGDVQTVKVHIRNLRSKIEEDPTEPHYILTSHGFGYRFAV